MHAAVKLLASPVAPVAQGAAALLAGIAATGDGVCGLLPAPAACCFGQGMVCIVCVARAVHCLSGPRRARAWMHARATARVRERWSDACAGAPDDLCADLAAAGGVRAAARGLGRADLQAACIVVLQELTRRGAAAACVCVCVWGGGGGGENGRG